MEIWYLSRLGRREALGAIALSRRTVSWLYDRLGDHATLQQQHRGLSALEWSGGPDVRLIWFGDFHGVKGLRWDDYQPGASFYVPDDALRKVTTQASLKSHLVTASDSFHWRVVSEPGADPIGTGRARSRDLDVLKLLHAPENEVPGVFRGVAGRHPSFALDALAADVKLRGAVPPRRIAHLLSPRDLHGLLECDDAKLRERAIGCVGALRSASRADAAHPSG